MVGSSPIVQLGRDAPKVVFTVAMLDQPEGVSLRLRLQAEAKAFRLIDHYSVAKRRINFCAEFYII